MSLFLWFPLSFACVLLSYLSLNLLNVCILPFPDGLSPLSLYIPLSPFDKFSVHFLQYLPVSIGSLHLSQVSAIFILLGLSIRRPSFRNFNIFDVEIPVAGDFVYSGFSCSLIYSFTRANSSFSSLIQSGHIFLVVNTNNLPHLGQFLKFIMNFTS